MPEENNAKAKGKSLNIYFCFTRRVGPLQGPNFYLLWRAGGHRPPNKGPWAPWTNTNTYVAQIKIQIHIGYKYKYNMIRTNHCIVVVVV